MNQIIEPKILKGTRDFLPSEMAKRKEVMNKMMRIFERFGYAAIETPIICPAETILGKYGNEGERLTYNFETRGGTKIALPFDLTVPFARFVAANYRNLPMPFKRYQIQRVWRAEKPQKGRLREFYQCDIDIIGTKSMICEAEIAKIIVEVFKELGFKKFRIKINSRRLMNTILKSFQIPEGKIMGTIRAIDKLEKTDKESVVKELCALNIGNSEEILSLLKPGRTNTQTLKKLSKYDTSEIKEFMSYCKAFSVEKYIEFDPSLARGLDYYTGITYEVVSEDVNFGTLCAGGRYDDLCSLFCEKNFSGVGVAFGFERIMLALSEMGKLKGLEETPQALVVIFDPKQKKNSLKTYADLLEAKINCEIYFEPGKLKKQLKYADKKEIRFAVIRGSSEIKRNTVAVKSMKTGKQKEIPYTQLIPYLTGYYEN